MLNLCQWVTWFVHVCSVFIPCLWVQYSLRSRTTNKHLPVCSRRPSPVWLAHTPYWNQSLTSCSSGTETHRTEGNKSAYTPHTYDLTWDVLQIIEISCCRRQIVEIIFFLNVWIYNRRFITQKGRDTQWWGHTDDVQLGVSVKNWDCDIEKGNKEFVCYYNEL